LPGFARGELHHRREPARGWRAAARHIKGMAMQKLRHFINGEFHDPAEDRWLDVFEPATGEKYAEAADGCEKDLDHAVGAALSAQHEWARTPADERARYLYKLGELIEQNLDRLAEAEARDNGKPLRVATSVDIPRAAQNMRFFAAAATQFASESHAMEQGA